jgi:hypothetical protein
VEIFSKAGGTCLPLLAKTSVACSLMLEGFSLLFLGIIILPKNDYFCMEVLLFQDY